MSFISRLIKVATLREHNLLEEELTNLKRKTDLLISETQERFDSTVTEIREIKSIISRNYTIHKQDHEHLLGYSRREIKSIISRNYTIHKQDHEHLLQKNEVQDKALTGHADLLTDLAMRIDKEHKQRIEAQGKIHEKISGYSFSRKKR